VIVLLLAKTKGNPLIHSLQQEFPKSDSKGEDTLLLFCLLCRFCAYIRACVTRLAGARLGDFQLVFSYATTKSNA